ncbi:hypothetical protein CQW23_29003 [Capsicum baccatum]|uniref:Fatty acyl-CoA reductase n=1 Tax=Capsicum baccatum TaxID=33114 RepID=A0A2G2VI58_CAPBA|nr:hypothetical protein CQW23_29003 [Capsicum baccatum]
MQFQHGNGIGIVEFFEGKNILVTGATGFLAKDRKPIHQNRDEVRVATDRNRKLRTGITGSGTFPEPRYRVMSPESKLPKPEYRNIYPVRTGPITESKLFKSLEELHGESYKLFIQKKLVPVVGNIHEPNLGMDIITAQKIAQEIDLIVDSAANTTFDERVMDPPIFYYRKGDLPAFLGDPDCLLDMVPVDMVVNATMAAIAKHGYLQNPELNVYHLISTSLNPVTIAQFFDYCHEYFTSFPFVNSKGDKVKIREMKYFNKVSAFENYIWKVIFKQHEVREDLAEEEIKKVQKRFQKKVEYLKQFSKLYEPYTFYKGRYV